MFLFAKNRTYKDSYLFKTVGVTNRFKFNHRERKRRCVHNRPPYQLMNRVVVGCVHINMFTYLTPYILSKLYLFVSFLYLI